MAKYARLTVTIPIGDWPEVADKIKAEALREFAERHRDVNQVLWLDLDEGRYIRLRDLAMRDAEQLDPGGAS